MTPGRRLVGLAIVAGLLVAAALTWRMLRTPPAAPGEIITETREATPAPGAPTASPPAPASM